MKRAYLMGCVFLLFSYDIVCKWSINFWNRLIVGSKLNWHDPLKENITCQFLVPKFHLGSHREECADHFSFNYAEGVGRMHGELVETIWAGLNWLQYSTREMSAGHRREVITEAMNYWNWGKVIRTGRLFCEFTSRTGETNVMLLQRQGSSESCDRRFNN